MAQAQVRRIVEEIRPDSIAIRAEALRVGVMLDTLHPAAWIKRALDEMCACGTIRVVLLVAAENHRIGGERTRDRACLLFRMYASLDRTLRRDGQDAFTGSAIEPEQYGECIWITGNGPDLSKDDVRTIRNADLDVIVNLSSIRATGEAGQAAAHGVWQFKEVEGSAARMQSVSGSDVVTDELLACDQDGASTVRQMLSPRDRNSWYREQNRRFWRRAEFLVQQLRTLQAGVLARNGQIHVPLRVTERETERLPGNLETAGMLAGMLVRGVRNVLHRRLLEPDWFVAVREHGISPTESSDMSGFCVLDSPRDRYYADPFVFEEGGRQFVFLEDYRRKQRKGVISFFPIPDDGRIERMVPRVALEAEYHLSYPTLFRWDGGIFMLAETSAAGRIEVFRAVDFPSGWEPHAVLMENIVAYDPTMIEYGGKFWMFCSGGCGGENSDLYVFHSDTPFGEWRAHARNPVVSDPCRARPAGAAFVYDRHVYRPGQDCSGIYGGAVTFNRIEVLTETEYREVPVARIDPGWLPGNIGTHSFNQNGRFQVVDGRTMRPRWRLAR